MSVAAPTTWEAADTTPAAVDGALRELLAAAHGAPARVLNLVVIADDARHAQVEERLAGVGRYHPSRLVFCRVRDGQRTLDASAWLGGEPVLRERVELLVGPQHLRGFETVIDPLLVSDITTMVWSPHGHDEAVQALRRLAQVVLLDSDAAVDAPRALDRAHDLLDDVWVVDLAWLRSTPWRERLAAAVTGRTELLARVEAVHVRHRAGAAASARLLHGWLASRLGWEPGSVPLGLAAVELPVPGLAGVTLELAGGETLSLDRAPGGLCETWRAADGSRRAFQVLGASRGEGGILGEGIRQALLRDPTYAPALRAAEVACRR